MRGLNKHIIEKIIFSHVGLATIAQDILEPVSEMLQLLLFKPFTSYILFGNT